MDFWHEPEFTISERVDPEKPGMAGRKKLKESASHHVQEICLKSVCFLSLLLWFWSPTQYEDEEMGFEYGSIFEVFFGNFRAIGASDAVHGS